MYVELFLLDDLLLNLLILRLAAALLSVRPPMLRMSAAALGPTLVSAAAAFLFPVLRSWYIRPALLALMALGLLAGSFKGFLRNMGVTLFATFVVGGLAVTIAFLTGGGVSGGFITGGIPLRLALLIVFAASFLPSAARRIMRRRLGNEAAAEVVILHRGVLRRFTALTDTGNSLAAPVSGLPVAVVYCPALRKFADIPIPAETAAGRTVLMGFRPERISVNGRETDCIVAVSERRLGAGAVIPPDIVN